MTIISAENKTDTRIYGTIYQSHEVDNIEQVSESTIRPNDGVRTGADPGEVKRVNFHPPFSEPPSFFFFLSLKY